MIVPLITSYTEFQQRLGYCKLLLTVAHRYPSATESALRKVDGLLFHPNADDSNTYFGEITGKPVKAKRRSNLALQNPGAKDLAKDASERSHGNEAKEIFTLSRALGLVDDRVVVLEDAMPLIRLLPTEAWNAYETATTAERYNPVILDFGSENVSEKTFFMLRLLWQDIAFALLPSALIAKRRGEFHRYVDWSEVSPSDFTQNMLTDVFDMVTQRHPRLFGTVQNARDLDSYFEGDLRKRKTHPGMRQQARFRHQATPRLEFLRELGILGAAAGHSPYTYVVTAATETFSSFVSDRVLRSLDLDEFVRAHAFELADKIYQRGAIQVDDPEIIFGYFLRAYGLLQRSIGNTPALSIAVLACLLAQDDRRLIEIDAMYRVGRDYAARKYSSHVRYSGGSVQVRDYLISIDHKLLRERGVSLAADSQNEKS